MKLIDTDIAIDHFHGNHSAREFFEDVLASGEPLCISVVMLTELLAGMRPDEEDLTEKLLSLFTVIEADANWPQGWRICVNSPVLTIWTWAMH
jgi:predicted nucleic acid-binding protein